MKRKFILIMCAVMAVIFSLAGCVDKNKDNASPMSSTTTTTAPPAATDGIMDDNGSYEAGRDGIVTDIPDDEYRTPGLTKDSTDRDDTGSVTEIGTAPADMDKKDGTITSDEAAFASSYILTAASADEKICWGLGKERDSTNRPIDAVRAEQQYSALGGRFLAGDGKICLTFDEGYENGYTASILDTLKEKDVKAVFFVTYDYCKTAPELVRRMIDEGHTVGNHTWSHPSMPGLTQKEVWAEVTKLHDYVADEFGYEMTLFRFPKGEFSARTLEYVHDLGYTSMFWSFAYADWDTSVQSDPAEALAKIEDSTHSGIYLLHAVSPTNAQILGSLIDFWRSSGYTVGSQL